MEVPTYEEFSALAKRVEELEKEVAFWKDLLSNVRWLTRVQTLQAIGRSQATLSRLTNKGVFTYEKQGRSIRYDVESVRKYLRSKRIEASTADKLVLAAYYSGK